MYTRAHARMYEGRWIGEKQEFVIRIFWHPSRFGVYFTFVRSLHAIASRLSCSCSENKVTVMSGQKDIGWDGGRVNPGSLRPHHVIDRGRSLFSLVFVITSKHFE